MILTGGILGFALALIRSKARDQAVTLEGYARLEPGMNYEQVCDALGRSGEDISVGATSRLYAWRNRDGSRLAAVFCDGELACFGANGLK